MTSERLTLTVPEVAELLGIGRGTAYECVRTGEIPSIRLGGRIVIPKRALHAMVEGVMVLNAQGRVLLVNPAFERMSGYGVAEVIGSNCRLMQGDQRDEDVATEIRESLAAGRAYHGLVRNQRKDGTAFQNELSITPVLGPEGAIAALHVHGPTYRFPDPNRTHDIGLLVSDAAQRLTEQLSEFTN